MSGENDNAVCQGKRVLRYDRGTMYSGMVREKGSVSCHATRVMLHVMEKGYCGMSRRNGGMQ